VDEKKGASTCSCEVWKGCLLDQSKIFEKEGKEEATYKKNRQGTGEENEYRPKEYLKGQGSCSLAERASISLGKKEGGS